MNDRAEMMNRVQKLSFVMFDTSLYLNNHPEDQAALNYFTKYQALAQQAQKDYEETFGPMTMEGVNAEQDGWSWLEMPWPWQVED